MLRQALSGAAPLDLNTRRQQQNTQRNPDAGVVFVDDHACLAKHHLVATVSQVSGGRVCIAR